MPRQLPSDADHTGRNFDDAEIALITKVLQSGTLNCTKGTFVKEFEKKFAELYNVGFVRTVTSGTAAVHTAIAAIDPEPGDEIITTSITDMGAITPILYQTAIPVFADVDPLTYNVTAETIAPKITERTKAIIVTPLFGNPVDMDPIMELAAKHNLPVIEDAAQAFLAEYKGKKVGSIGDIACFSLQQGKHMTTGEGGFVLANNEKYQRRINLFVDKAWGYGDPEPDHYFLAMNYRMTELQGAVALAQLDKLHSVVEKRTFNAKTLDELISNIPGVAIPKVTAGGKHVYWKYCLRIDPKFINGGVNEFSKQLKQLGIFSVPRYIQKPAFMCQVLKDQVTFGKSQFAFRGEHRRGAADISYNPADFPGTLAALEDVCVLPWNENYTDKDVQFIADSIIQVAQTLKV